MYSYVYLFLIDIYILLLLLLNFYKKNTFKVKFRGFMDDLINDSYLFFFYSL